MITYEQIQKANEGLTSIDFKGKDYVLVAERVKAFRKLFPDGFITTTILRIQDDEVVMQSEAGYFENGERIVLASGLACEKESSSYINRYSKYENCETSAVGRCLGFLALGIDGAIASAEELANAVTNQNKPQKPRKSKPEPVTEPSSDPEPTVPVYDLTEIRSKLDTAIKTKTKDMDRNGKINFLNTVICPALDGERNWKLVEDPELLLKLLAVVETKAA